MEQFEFTVAPNKIMDLATAVAAWYGGGFYDYDGRRWTCLVCGRSGDIGENLEEVPHRVLCFAASVGNAVAAELDLPPHTSERK